MDAPLPGLRPACQLPVHLALGLALALGCADEGRRGNPRPSPDSAAVDDTDDTVPTGSTTDTGDPATTPTDTGSSPTQPPVLVITENPNNVLSCLVRWQTTAAMPTELQVEGGLRTLRFHAPEATTDHEVWVIGLTELTRFTVSALDPADDAVLATAAWDTGRLPEVVPRPTLLTSEPRALQPGWTLFNVSNSAMEHPAVALMVDEDAQPVWYAINEPDWDRRGDVDVSLVPGPAVLIGHSGALTVAREFSLTGEVLWEGPEDNKQLHHTIQKLPDGSYVTLEHEKGDGITLDTVLVLSPTHERLWTWDLRDHLTLPEDAEGDWSHCNSVFPGLDPDQFIVSCRNLDSIFAISRSTGDILWRLGAHGDFAPDPDATWPFTHNQHAPRELPDGHILTYDNLGRGGRSRAVEYALDHAAMTSTIVWQFPGDAPVDDWYANQWSTPIWGDADRLPNGNTLITAGQRERNDHSRIFEVSPDGVVVWAIEMHTLPGDIVGVYRAERITPPVEVVRR